VGILAEYDALPGVGNLAEPRKVSRTDGITSGHGCGHNLFAAGSAYAAVATKRAMQQQNLPGSLIVFGTPAEETLIGKVYMAKENVFHGTDVILEWHPNTETKAGFEPTLAMNSFEVEFFGQAAHGAIDPWNGRSALDAVEMMNYGVNLMREHIHTTARIHYVIKSGGDVPNVVPEYAKVWYFVRDTNRIDVDNYYARLLKIAEGAAMATNTTHKINLLAGVHQLNINEPLIYAIQENLKIVGPPKFTADEIKWAQELQKSAGKEPSGFFPGIRDIPANWRTKLPTGGSTDVAEVSFIAPTGGFLVATAPLGVPWHSWASAASHGTPIGFKGAEVAAKVLALTAIDVLTNEALRKAAMQDFIKRTGGRPYKSPLPQDQKVTLPVSN
jgi:aminobenzoyl-glutamate utilization protein B